MTDLFQQRGIKFEPATPKAGGGRDLFAERGITIESPSKDGITGPQSLIENIGQGFNRGLGKLVSGADYALLGFLDDTKEGQSQRPLGYLAQVLKGEQDVPFTEGRRFAQEPTTAGERIIQRGGEMVAESVAPLGMIASAGRTAIQPAASATGRALQSIVETQAARPAVMAGSEAVSAFGAGMGEEVGRQASPDSVIAPIIGGIAGGLAPTALTAPVARKALGKGVNAVRDMISPSVQAQRAREVVSAQLGPHLDGVTAQQGLARGNDLAREIPGFSPDLAQRTRSEALKATKDDMVKQASGAELDAIRARDVQSRQALRDYATRVAPEGQSSAEAALDPLIQQRRQTATNLRKTQQQIEVLPKPNDIARTEKVALQQLQERTSGARGEVAGRITRIDRTRAGAQIREGLLTERQRRMADLGKEAKQLGIDEFQLTTPFRGFTAQVDEWRGSLLPSQAENMPEVMRDIEMLRTRPTVTFKDVKSLRESLVDSVLEASRDTSPGHRKRLANAIRLRDMLDEQVLGPNVLEGPSSGMGMDDALDRARHYASNPDFEQYLLSQRVARGGAKPFETLTDFLVRKGGIPESRGELGARDISARSRPGLYRKQGSGMSHEDAALAAWEEGYFPGLTQRPDPDDLLRAIEDELAGRPAYKETDAPVAAQLAERAEVSQDMADAFDDLGLDWKAASPDELRARLDEMGQEPIALSEAADRWRDFRRRYFEEIIEPFERGTVFKTTRRDGTGFYRTLDEDVAIDFLDSADAARQIRSIAQSQPGMLATLEAVALDDLASSAVTNGVISPRALEKWIERRRGALDELPNVQRAVNEIAAAVTDVEGRFQTGKRLIEERRVGEVARVANERQRLQGAMQPLLERMGKLNERKMALEDTMLSRRLAAIERGSQDPAAVIDQAIKNPKLMERLWSEVSNFPEAKASLRRHVWDSLATLDGARLDAFLTENEASLKTIFDQKHLTNLGKIRDGLQMLEFAPAVASGKPIKADTLSMIQATTGLNPQQMSSRFLAVKRGRSSRFVESFDSFMRWMSARNVQAMDKLMREALFNPEVAESLVDSVTLNSKGIPNKKLRSWLWNLGFMAPIEDGMRETETQVMPAPAPAPAAGPQSQLQPEPAPQPSTAPMIPLSDPDTLSSLWLRSSGNNELRRAIRRDAWSGLAEPTGAAVREWTQANERGLRAIYPPDHLKRVSLLADGMALADSSVSVAKPSRQSVQLAQFADWLGQKNPEGAAVLMREALANPAVATAITESLAVKAPKAGASRLEQFATRKLQEHMNRLGVAVA